MRLTPEVATAVSDRAVLNHYSVDYKNMTSPRWICLIVTEVVVNRSYKQPNMANLLEAFGSEFDQYGGSTMDSFECKFWLFLERCDQADIEIEDWHKASPSSYLDMLCSTISTS